MKRVLKWVGIVLGLALLGAAGFVFAQVSAFDASIAKRYDVAAPAIRVSQDPS